MTGAEKWARPMAVIERWERHVPWMLAVLCGLCYSLTMSPTIGHTDGGELTAVAYTFGVAHPTGYPLFTLLGWIATHVPVGSVALRLNVLCLLFVTAGVWAWAGFLREFFIQMRTTVKKGDSSYALRIKVANLSGTIAGTLMLCFGRTWWMQSTSAEVYSLQCLLLGLTFWALLRAWWEKEKVFRAWAIFVVMLALCFTNHLTAIALLPAVLYMYFAKFKFSGQSIVQGLKLAGVGFGVLIAFYGMLFVVAQSSPAYNWGNPEDWSRLWHHMSGKQFSVWMFNGPKAFGVNLLAYLNRLPNEFGWDLIWPKIPIWIGLGGLVFQGMTYALQRRREWAIFFGIAFLANVFWAANYSIKDPEPYFILSFMVIAFLGAMVLRWAWIGMKKVAPYLSVAYVIVVGFQVFWNFGVTNQKGAWQYEDYARNALTEMKPNAIVISKFWDGFVAPAYYLQACEDFRRDVTVVDYSLLHDRHWYPAQLRAQAPEVADLLGSALDEWEEAVYDFDINGKVNPMVLSPRFDAVYNGILALNGTRPIYLTQDMFDAISRGEVGQPKDLVPVPMGYTIRLLPPVLALQFVPLPPQGELIRYGGNPKEEETLKLQELIAETKALRKQYESANAPK